MGKIGKSLVLLLCSGWALGSGGSAPAQQAAPAPAPPPGQAEELRLRFARLESLLPSAAWQAMQQDWPAAMVRQVAALLGERDRAEKILAGWRAGRSLVWICRRAPGRMVALSVVQLENEAAARAYFGFALGLQRKRDSLAGGGCTASVKVLQSQTSDLRLPHADQAVRCDKRFQLATGSPPVPVTLLLARSGSLVLELDWHGEPVDMNWAGALLNAFFNRPPSAGMK